MSCCGQRSLLDTTLSDAGQALAQRYAAQLIALQPSAASITRAAAIKPDASELGRYQEVDLGSLELVRPRSVGVEHAALWAMRQCGLEDKLTELGWRRVQIAAILGNIVGRMAHPGSELATPAWLQQRSALGELIGYDFEAMDGNRLYRASDALYKHREALQDHLFAQAQSIFALGRSAANCSDYLGSEPLHQQHCTGNKNQRRQGLRHRFFGPHAAQPGQRRNQQQQDQQLPKFDSEVEPH